MSLVWEAGGQNKEEDRNYSSVAKYPIYKFMLKIRKTDFLKC